VAANVPTDLDGQPLRGGGGASARDGWAQWSAWSVRVEQRIANQSTLLEGVLNTLERMAGALQDERRQRELEIERLKLEIDRLKGEVSTQRTIASWLKSKSLNGSGHDDHRDPARV
jgi:hypothetical protein